MFKSFPRMKLLKLRDFLSDRGVRPVIDVSNKGPLAYLTFFC